MNHPRCPTPDVSRATCFLCRCSPPPPLTMLRERGVIEGPLALSPPSGRWVGDGQRARSVCLSLPFFLSFFFSLSLLLRLSLLRSLLPLSIYRIISFSHSLSLSYSRPLPPPLVPLSGGVAALLQASARKGPVSARPLRARRSFPFARRSLSHFQEDGGVGGGGRERKGLWR